MSSVRRCGHDDAREKPQWEQERELRQHNPKGAPPQPAIPPPLEGGEENRSRSDRSLSARPGGGNVSRALREERIDSGYEATPAPISGLTAGASTSIAFGAHVNDAGPTDVHEERNAAEPSDGSSTISSDPAYRSGTRVMPGEMLRGVPDGLQPNFSESGNPSAAAGSAQDEGDDESPRQFLDRITGMVSKSELSNIIAKKSPFMGKVLQMYLERFDFSGIPIDFAIRIFFFEFHLPKESQMIDRIIKAFATKYHADNDSLFPNADCAYLVAFALVLLHTDLHNRNNRRKMVKEQFVMGIRQTNGGQEVPPELLEILYENTAAEKFAMPPRDDDIDVDGQMLFNRPASKGRPRSVSSAGLQDELTPPNLGRNVAPKDSAALMVVAGLKRAATAFPGSWHSSTARPDFAWAFPRSKSSATVSGRVEEGRPAADTATLRRGSSMPLAVASLSSRESDASASALMRLGLSWSSSRSYPFSIVDRPAYAQLLGNLELVAPSRHQYSYLGPCSPLPHERIRLVFLNAALHAEPDPQPKGSSILPQPAGSPQPGPGFPGLKLPGGPAPAPSSPSPSDLAVICLADRSVLRITREGPLARKSDMLGPGKRAGRRFWKAFWVVLSGSQLLFFQATQWVHPNGRRADGITSSASKPHSTLSTAECICLVDKELNGLKPHYVNVFRLVIPDGRQFLLRADSPEEMTEWMALINYASTYKSIGLHVRGVGACEEHAEPQATNKPKRPGDTRSVRAAVLKSKISDLTQRLDVAEGQIASGFRLYRHLRLAIPLTKRGREKALAWAAAALQNVRGASMEAERLRCYLATLNADLAEEEAAGCGPPKGET